MTLERRNPLPVGIYHIDIAEKNLQAFLDWRAQNKADVKVRKTHQDLERRVLDGTASKLSWILFECLRPVHWDSQRFGFPTIADQGLSTERPQTFEPIKDATDRIADSLPKPETLVTTILVVAAIVAGVWVYREVAKT